MVGAAERTLFHLLGREEWEQARRAASYRPSSLEREGFIHLSTKVQLLRTAAKWFAGRDDLLVLAIEADRLGPALRYEPVGEELFPHLYGPLMLEAVREVAALRRGHDGAFEEPTAW